MILIKIGGGKSINYEAVARDVKELSQKEPVIIVHGASSIRDEIAEKMGSPTQTVTSPSGISSVFTNEKALDIFLMVYAGLVNKKIVATLLKHGVNAIGLSGVDGKLWIAKRKAEVQVKDGTKIKLMKGNFTGRVEEINTHLLETLTKARYIPVLCPPALSFEHEIVNTDNDWAIAVMAGKLKATKLVYLFEAAGLLKNIHDPTSVISTISVSELSTMMGVALGRMKKKVLGAEKALKEGVAAVYWGDGRIEHPVRSALAGKGTIITP